ncbi:MAG: VOC family protein [Methanomassiliicoccales archaeon]|nr:VOC family protein [Methanomassiliicoccales archaeon]
MDGVKSFNIPVQDMKAQAVFYRSVFGWGVTAIEGSSGDYHSVITTETDKAGIPVSKGFINGGLFQKGTHGIDGTFLEVEVNSIDESLDKVIRSGGKVVKPKSPILDFGFFAIIQDPEGNCIGLMEYLK